MSRKDYQRAAAIIREARLVQPEHDRTVSLFKMFFSNDNQRFDPVLFQQACDQPPKVSRG